MPLDEEEKRVLAKKLEEQRRAMWRGESVKPKGKKSSRPDRTATFQSDSEPDGEEGIPLDWGTHQSEEEEVVFTRIPTRIIEAEFTREEEDQQENSSEAPSEDTVLELEVPQVGNQRRQDEVEIIRRDRSSSLDEAKQTVAEKTKPESGVDLKWRLQDDETKQLVDKIKAQRQEVWGGESPPTKRRKRLKRKTKKSEREFWNPESGKSEKSPKIGLSWGGTFIVVFGVITAILLGVLLGFVIANAG